MKGVKVLRARLARQSLTRCNKDGFLQLHYFDITKKQKLSRESTAKAIGMQFGITVTAS